MSCAEPRRPRLRFLLSLASLLLACSPSACGSDPSDGASTVGASGTGEVGSGGANATGGATAIGGGSFGGAGTGGVVSGGATATGGASSGGATSGGASSGGTTTGGTTSGGATSGGASSGGASSGGASSGGTTSGGASPGGASPGGASPGGASPGGASPGGASSGGASPGGASSGGATTVDGPRWLGRVDATEPDAVRFAWQGAGLIATVNGPEIAVTLRTEGTDTVFFQPLIDGVEATRFEVTSGADQTVTLASGLSATDHVVELLRDTEGMYGVSTFLGFSSGTVVGAPAASGRLVEVIGDSISAGYGNLGVEPHPNWVADPACHWTAENSSYYATYAAIAGRALGAEVSTIARSGWGMYRDLDGNVSGVLSSVYGNAVGTDDSTPWGFAEEASAVVINLGTNDQAQGDPGTPYESAYLDFLDTVRSHYPDAWIFLAIGSMLSDADRDAILGHLENVLAARVASGDARVSVLDLGVQDLGSDGSVPSGCDWHPSVADHQRMAAILEGELNTRLGW